MSLLNYKYFSFDKNNCCCFCIHSIYSTHSQEQDRIICDYNLLLILEEEVQCYCPLWHKLFKPYCRKVKCCSSSFFHMQSYLNLHWKYWDHWSMLKISALIRNSSHIPCSYLFMLYWGKSQYHLHKCKYHMVVFVRGKFMMTKIKSNDNKISQFSL